MINFYNTWLSSINIEVGVPKGIIEGALFGTINNPDITIIIVYQEKIDVSPA